MGSGDAVAEVAAGDTPDHIGRRVRFATERANQAARDEKRNAAADEDIAEAQCKHREGFGFFKLKVGTKPVETEIAATLALREALGAALPLCADANCGMSPAAARRYVANIQRDIDDAERPSTTTTSDGAGSTTTTSP